MKPQMIDSRLTDGQRVVTLVNKDPQNRAGYAKGVREKCQWGVFGTILQHSDSHGLCYEVQHNDGTTSWYEANELESA